MPITTKIVNLIPTESRLYFIQLPHAPVSSTTTPVINDVSSTTTPVINDVSSTTTPVINDVSFTTTSVHNDVAKNC